MKVAPTSGMNSSNSKKETDRKRKKFKPPPPFIGVELPLVVSNEEKEESDLLHASTRRTGGFGGIGSSFSPVFEPAMPTFEYSSSTSFEVERSASSIPVSNLKPESSSDDMKAGFSKMTSIPSRAGWNLTDVPTLPEFHPLERTAVCVPHASPVQVARRVSQVLYERSIDATYDDNKAKASCITPDHVDFRVRLYRGREQHQNKVIVEVQRRNGSSISFHADTKAILNAAEGKESSSSDDDSDDTILPLDPDSDEDDEWEPSDSVTSLGTISMMLQHPFVDTHNLALQTLMSLTDPTKMGISTALVISKAILEPNNDVGTKLMYMVSPEPGKQDSYLEEMRIKAMQVLANAIGVVVHYQEVGSGTTSSTGGDLMYKLRPVLLHALHDAAFNTRMAYLAAKCVEGLFQAEHDITEFHEPLKEAFAVGQSKHAGLAFQTHKCLGLLGH